METIIPISALNTKNFQFNYSTVVFLRGKTQQENFGVDSAKWKQLFPFPNSYTILSLLYILYTVHFSNRNTTRNEHTAIIS